MIAILLSVFLLFLSFTSAQVSITATVTVTGSVSITATTSSSITATVTVSSTGSSSLTASASVSVSPSVTVTATRTWTPTPSWTVTPTQSNTPSTTATASRTPSPSTTMSSAAKVQNIMNKCKNHAQNICPAWTDPTGTLFFFNVFYRVTGTTLWLQLGASNIFGLSARISGLTASTSYDIKVVGVNLLGVQGNFNAAPVQTFMTSLPTPKQSVSRDISNVMCAQTISNTTNRVNIVCTWVKSPVNPIVIETSCRCTSPVRRSFRIRRDFKGAQASTVTSVTFQVNRDVATCNIFIKAVYPTGFINVRKSGKRNHFVVILGN